MPFVLPTQVVAKLPISRFKNVDYALYDSPDFRLQKRKKAFRNAEKSLYRIVTSHRNAGSRYLVARDDDIHSLLRNEWHYCAHELPALIPPGLDYKDRTLWLIAHFTKLALEQKALSVRQRRWSITSEHDLQPNTSSQYNFTRLDTAGTERDASPDDSPEETPLLSPMQSATSAGNERHNSLSLPPSNQRQHSHQRASTSMPGEHGNDNHKISLSSPILLPSVPIIPPLQHSDCNICVHNYNLRLSLLELPNNTRGDTLTTSGTASTDADNSTAEPAAATQVAGTTLQLSPSPSSNFQKARANRLSLPTAARQPSTSPQPGPTAASAAANAFSRPAYRHKNITEEVKADRYAFILPLALLCFANLVLLGLKHGTESKLFLWSLAALNATVVVTLYKHKPAIFGKATVNERELLKVTPSFNEAVAPQSNATVKQSPPIQSSRIRGAQHGRSQTALVSPSNRMLQIANMQQPLSPLSPTTPFEGQQSPYIGSVQAGRSQNRFTGMHRPSTSSIHHSRSGSTADDINFAAMSNALNPTSPNMLQRGRSTGASTPSSRNQAHNNNGSNNNSFRPHHQKQLSRMDETDEEEHSHADRPAILHNTAAENSDEEAHDLAGDTDEEHERDYSHTPNRRSSDTTNARSGAANRGSTRQSRSEQQGDLLVPGKTLHSLPPDTDPGQAKRAWQPLDATTFKVRKGPDYAHNKQKEASKSALLDVNAIDFYATSSKCTNVGRFVALPGQADFDAHAEGKCDKGHCSSEPYLPATFIVHWQLPGYGVENPVWGKKVEDGEGHSIAFYYTLSKDTQQQIMNACKHHDHSGKGSGSSSKSKDDAKDDENNDEKDDSKSSEKSDDSNISHNFTCFCQPDESKLSPAIRLLHKFVTTEDGSDLRKRFKAICRLANLDEVQLGGMANKLVHQYNGTPFLIRTTSTFHHGHQNSYFEIDVDVHRFSYPARVGLGGIRERLRTCVFDFAFLVEGHSDDELPECILSASRLYRLDFDAAEKLPDKYLH